MRVLGATGPEPPTALCGRYGILLRASLSTVLDQYANFALSYLLYDFVAVEGLRREIHEHTSGVHPRLLMAQTSQRLLDLGICFDVEDAVDLPGPGLTEPEFRRALPLSSSSDFMMYRELDQAYQETQAAITVYDAARAAGIERTPGDEKVFMRAGSASLAAIRFLSRLSLTSLGYTVDDGRFLDHQTGHDRNDELRPILKEGLLPLHPPRPESRPLVAGEAVRSLQLVLRHVPFPAAMPADELVDFRNSKQVRQSLGSFRRHADALIGPQAPASFVQEQLRDDYETYRAEVMRLKSRTHFGNIKFGLSSLAGFAEDIIKLRFESLSKRPFEITEWFLDKKYAYREHEKSPFYFLLERDDRAS